MIGSQLPGVRLTPDDFGDVRSEKILAIFDPRWFEYVDEIPKSIETARQTDNGR
jgi:hypothetical protein